MRAARISRASAALVMTLALVMGGVYTAGPASAAVAKENLLVSHASGSPVTTGAGGSFLPLVSGDGRYVAFSSNANNLVPGQVEGNSTGDAFVYDKVTGITRLVSGVAGSATQTANFVSTVTSISRDGRYLAFNSGATNVVAGQTDTNGFGDVFLFDRVAGTTRLVSGVAGSATTAGNASSGSPTISADGNYVVFSSQATDLVAGQTDTNGGSDVFVFDRAAGTTRLASGVAGSSTVTGDGASGGGDVQQQDISDDGGRIAFESFATNLIAGQNDSNAQTDMFVFNRAAATTRLLSGVSGSATTTGDERSTSPDISGDGAFVGFDSIATNLVTGQIDAANSVDVFVADAATGVSTLVSHAAGSLLTRANNVSVDAKLSGDGEWIAFNSLATNLVAGQVDTNGQADAFLFNRLTGAVTLVSHIATSPVTTPGTPGNASGASAISYNGHYLAFTSEGSTMVTGQTNASVGADVFLYTIATGAVELVSHVPASTATTGNSASFRATIDDTGAAVTYESHATDLVTGQVDANANSDIFLYTRLSPSLPALVRTGTTRLLRNSTTTGGADLTYTYGTNPSTSVFGDWNGDGSKTPGIFQGGQFKLSNTNATNASPTATFTFGDQYGYPVAGDFDGDGLDDVAVFRAGTWQVRMTDDGATSSISFGTGSWPNPWPVAGDWDGDGVDGVGHYTNSTGTWVLRSTALAGGTVAAGFVYRPTAGSFPVTGDWDGDGDDTVGLRTNTSPFIWQLNNANDASAADVSFNFGAGSNETPFIWR